MEMLELLPEHSMLSLLFLGELVLKHIDVINIRRNSHTGQQEFLTQGGLAVLASALADEAAGRDKVVMMIVREVLASLNQICLAGENQSPHLAARPYA